MPHINTSPGMRSQAGAATLVVVLVLSFTLLLAVAFASKSLVFEQRTSSNQYHATQAFEIAEAGAGWTLAQLNGGRVGDDCAPSGKSTDASLRDRYLSIDATGVITPSLKPDQVQL